MTDTITEATAPVGAFPVDPVHQRQCEFLAGFRALLRHLETNIDALDTYPSLQLIMVADDAAEFAAMSSALGGQREKSANEAFMRIERDFGGGVSARVLVQRGEVCEAKVVGQRTVTKPDPDAPMVEVVEDVIEWTCTPVLAQRDPENPYDLDFAECHDDAAHDRDEAE